MNLLFHVEFSVAVYFTRLKTLEIIFVSTQTQNPITSKKKMNITFAYLCLEIHAQHPIHKDFYFS